MAEETLSEKLARHHAALRLDQLPTEVVETAKLHILDSLGCVLAGSRLEVGRLAYNLAIETSGNTGVTLCGTGRHVSLPDAVQAMTAAARQPASVR